MNRFSTFCVFAAVAGSLQNAPGQMINATVQTASPRVAASRSAPATAPKAFGVATTRMAPQVIARPAGVPAQRFNSNLPRTIAQPATNLRPNYSAGVGISTPAFAALNAHRGAPGQPAITVDPTTRQTELRTLAAMHQRRGIVTRQGNTLDPTTREIESRTLQKMREHREFGANNQTLATINPQRNVTTQASRGGTSTRRNTNHRKTTTARNGTTKRIALAMTKRSAATGTSRMTETGGTIIVTRSFSLAPDTISWTGVTGIQRMATIHCRATTIMMGQSTLIMICSPTR